MKWTIQTLLMALTLLAIPHSVHPQISPGKLSKAHETLEGISNCTKCHEVGKGAQVAASNCLQCHTSLKARIDANQGFHSSSATKSKNCFECHSEHHGREFDLVFWENGQKSFNHALTGYELVGKHGSAECRECHKTVFTSLPKNVKDDTWNAEKTFIGLNQKCLTCHVDEHGDQLSDDCLSCHDSRYQNWKPATGFDHSKTKYALTGKHEAVSCEKCHVQRDRLAVPPPFLINKAQNSGKYAIYSGLNYSNCTPCHADVHKNRFGQNCAECHVTKSFKTIKGDKFDHNLTKFPLKGKHQSVTCTKCHTSGDMTREIAHSLCSDCHSDEHRGQFAKRPDQGRCESCHTERGWVPALYGPEEHEQSHYPLTGSHLAVPCNMCHTQIEAAKPTESAYARFIFPSTRCLECHPDPHKGQLNIWIEKNGCEFCHSTATWHVTSFDHNRAAFKLTGKHREILCLSCHTVKRDDGNKEMWMKPLSGECFSCHTDIHRGQFVKADGKAARCEKCHDPSGWRDLSFLHNRDSRFKLDGAHQNVACKLCHKPQIQGDGSQLVVYKPLGIECVDCHGSSKAVGGGR